MNKRFLFLFILCQLLVFPATATHRQLLDRDWRFTLGDPEGAGLPGYDDSMWRKLSLPHDWSIEAAPSANEPSGNDGGYLPTGIGWYRKHITLSKRQLSENLHYLYFEGVYERSTIYVNGNPYQGHPYGYSSFYIFLGEDLVVGDNVIAVRADNSHQKNSRWFTGSGIYRHVWLVEKPIEGIAVNGIHVTTPDLHTAVITTTLRNDGCQDSGLRHLQVTVDGKTVVKEVVMEGHGDLQETVSLTLPDVRPWSPDSPQLYQAEVRLTTTDGQVLDGETVTFGFRTVAYDAHQGLLLNGQPLKLCGGCLHHDNGILGAAAFDRAEERKAELMKQAGFNAVRTSHNPPSPAFLDACDRVGLMVIDEAFDGWRAEKNKHDYHEFFDEWYARDIEAMVCRDRNHPSIFCWSIGNEIIERKSPEAVKIAHNLVSEIHRWDLTRPVTSALAAWDSDWEIYDPLAAEHDIVGYNYMIHKHATDHQRVAERVMMQTESYPRDAFQNWVTVHDNPYVIGDFVWTAIDYIGESGIGRYWYEGEPEGEHYQRPMWPAHGAYCGDIDLTGWRKPVSHYRQLLWNEQAGLYLAVREPDGYFGQHIKAGLWGVHPTWDSWTWPGWEGKEIQVEVYSRFPSVRLYLNDRFIGEKPTTRQEQFKALFTLPYTPGTLRAEAGLSTAVTLQTASEPQQVRLTADRVELRADGQDLCFVTVELLDGNGTLCPNADNLLQFTVSGPASLLAVGNANIKDTDRYNDHSHRVWRGRALAVLRMADIAGDVSLSVTGEGLKPVTLKLTSLPSRQ